MPSFSQTLILLAIAGGMGLFLAGVFTPMADQAVQYTSENSDSITLLYSQAVPLAHDEIKENGFTLTNSTGSVIPSSNYTLDASAGTVTLDESSLNNTAATASYEYRTDLSDASATTLYRNLPLFLVLAILAAVIVIVYSYL